MWCVNRYTKPGDTILDPMSGTGTIHLAAFEGRNTIGVELVPGFVNLQEQNWKNLLDLWFKDELYSIGDFWDNVCPTINQIGRHSILLGDSRAILPTLDPVDAIIFSPPYGSLWAFKSGTRDSKIAQEKNYVVGYDESPAQVGNLTNYAAYLAAMQYIYTACAQVLKPGGTLVTIVKDYIKGGERIECSKDNLRLCVKAGLVPIEWHYRDTSVQNNPFSARNTALRKSAGKHKANLEINTEDIIVLQKPR